MPFQAESELSAIIYWSPLGAELASASGDSVRAAGPIYTLTRTQEYGPDHVHIMTSDRHPPQPRLSRIRNSVSKVLAEVSSDRPAGERTELPQRARVESTKCYETLS